MTWVLIRAFTVYCKRTQCIPCFLLYFCSKHRLNHKIILFWLDISTPHCLLLPSQICWANYEWFWVAISMHVIMSLCKLVQSLNLPLKSVKEFALHSLFAILWKLSKNIYSCKQLIWGHFPLAVYFLLHHFLWHENG